MEQVEDTAELRPWRATDMRRLANDLAIDGAYIAPQSRLRRAQSGNPYANVEGVPAPLIIDVDLPPFDGTA